ncbi:aspartate kinase [candidate division KSB1 bacterium]|nr:aspartate kinase [candidate division KSB1 bacterium]
MSTLVMKFGGTSVGSADAINKTAAIVLEHAPKWDRIAVVVSAMSGVTNALVKGAETAACGDDKTYLDLHHDLKQKHIQAIDSLISSDSEKEALGKAINEILDEFSILCHSVFILGEVTNRALDTITSLGERISAQIVAAVLRQKGAKSEAVKSTELVVTDDNFQNAMPIMDATNHKVNVNLVPLLNDGVIAVVTGFMGATRNGITTTLGRGASDYIASILGLALKADEVWIWTDVDGVMTAAPNIVPDAKIIHELTYSEVGELAYFGAKVLHPQTIRPVVEGGIPLCVKNTFNPTCPGTKIVAEPSGKNGAVKAVTSIKNLSMITVEGRGMMGVPGIAARTFAAVSRQNANVLMISQASSEQSISFFIPSNKVNSVVKSLQDEFSVEIQRRDIDRIVSLDNVVIVSAVGAGMRGTPGVAARIFQALGESNINVVAIAQGSSECSISLVVMDEQSDDAVRQIHQKVIMKK